jgi:hypothetical protein
VKTDMVRTRSSPTDSTVIDRDARLRMSQSLGDDQERDAMVQHQRSRGMAQIMEADLRQSRDLQKFAKVPPDIARLVWRALPGWKDQVQIERGSGRL